MPSSDATLNPETQPAPQTAEPSSATLATLYEIFNNKPLSNIVLDKPEAKIPESQDSDFNKLISITVLSTLPENKTKLDIPILAPIPKITKVVKEPEIVNEPEVVKEPEIVKELETIKEPEVVKEPETEKKPVIEKKPELVTQPTKPANKTVKEPEVAKKTETEKEPEATKEPEEQKEPESNKKLPSDYTQGPIKKDPLPKTHAETLVSIGRGERFELRFPGSGWIFLGDDNNNKGINYNSRRFEEESAVFSLTASKDGEYLLRFERQNPVDRNQDVSLVRVTVGIPKAETNNTSKDTSTTNDNSRKQNANNPSQTQSQTAINNSIPSQSEETKTKSSTPNSVPNNNFSNIEAAVVVEALPSAPDELIALARTALEQKKIDRATEILDKYLSLYPAGSDEVFYLYAKACELESPWRNIKKSYAYYKKVRDEYPRSSFWKDASDKVYYLEKHFYGLR